MSQGRFSNKLVEIDPNFEKNRFIVYGAALLHDLGHGPLSHTSEEIFDHNHEKWSKSLIKDYSPINSILKKFGNEIPKNIAELFSSKNLISHPMKTLISSEIDCDRLDYLLRDSYNTGTKYGLVDLERIISALTFAPDGGIAIKPKGVIAIEHFLVLRNIMYRTIYNHRINEISSWILENIIKSIKNGLQDKICIDQSLFNWIFSYKDLSFDDFLANDDVMLGYHLMQWKRQAPEPLSTLCKMFLDRHLLKATNINFLTNIQKLELLAFTKKKCEESNLNSNLFCGIKEKKFRGFESNNSLKVWDGNYLINLDKASSLVKTLMKGEDSSLLIYPEEIKDDIKKRILQMKNN